MATMLEHKPTQSESLLGVLQRRTRVSCDTLDASVAAKYSSLFDATSNQVIAKDELARPENKDIWIKVLGILPCLQAGYLAPPEEILAEAATVVLAVRMLDHVECNIHIQINPFHAYSCTKIIENAQRIRAFASFFSYELDVSRVCIKIPSTWEGLKACHTLRKHGVKTLGTTLFSIEQAVLAGKAGCTYVAPYVHELKEQVEAEYWDEKPHISLVSQIQQYYRRNAISTKVMPASLATYEECMLFAGMDYITIAPALLSELSKVTPHDKWSPSSIEDTSIEIPSEIGYRDHHSLVDDDFKEDEAAFRLAFSRSDNGQNEAKQIQALNIFCDAQLQLEAMARQILKETS